MARLFTGITQDPFDSDLDSKRGGSTDLPTTTVVSPVNQYRGSLSDERRVTAAPVSDRNALPGTKKVFHEDSELWDVLMLEPKSFLARQHAVHPPLFIRAGRVEGR